MGITQFYIKKYWGKVCCVSSWALSLIITSSLFKTREVLNSDTKRGGWIWCITTNHRFSSFSSLWFIFLFIDLKSSCSLMRGWGLVSTLPQARASKHLLPSLCPFFIFTSFILSKHCDMWATECFQAMMLEPYINCGQICSLTMRVLWLFEKCRS